MVLQWLMWSCLVRIRFEGVDVHPVNTLELVFADVDYCYSAFGAQIVLRDRGNSAEGRPNALMTETPDYFMEAYKSPMPFLRLWDSLNPYFKGFGMRTE